MSLGVEIRDLVVRYGSTVAVDRATLTVAPGTICGLLGRNGSGKTTLLSTIAAFRRPDGGEVLVDGRRPWENASIVEQVCLIREGGDLQTDVSMRENLEYVEQARPHYDAELAGMLMDRFELDPKRKPSRLSRGKRSAFGVVVGLASRAPLTLLDEVHLGMDAPSRYVFYDALLADYVEHPRTFVISSHLIDEVQRMLETVVVLHRGQVLLADDAEALRTRGTSVTGPADVVDGFVAGREVLNRLQLGRTARVMVYGALDDDAAAQAARLGVELGPVDLQDLFVHLTSEGHR